MVKMDPNKAMLVVCLTVFIVIGVNAAIYAAFRRGNEANQIELLRKAASRARHPWAKEDQALEELSKRVADLKKGRPATFEGEQEENPREDRSR